MDPHTCVAVMAAAAAAVALSTAAARSPWWSAGRNQQQHALALGPDRSDVYIPDQLGRCLGWFSGHTRRDEANEVRSAVNDLG